MAPFMVLLLKKVRQGSGSSGDGGPLKSKTPNTAEKSLVSPHIPTPPNVYTTIKGVIVSIRWSFGCLEG